MTTCSNDVGSNYYKLGKIASYWLCAANLCTYLFFVFNLESPTAPRQRSQNFSSATLRASGAQPSKEAPGISASVNTEAIITQ